MGKYRITTDGGVYEITTEDAPTPAAESTDQPSMLSKAASATGQFLRGLVPDTIKGVFNTAKEALPSPDTGDAAKQAKEMIDKGDYLGAAKHLVSKAVESTPGGKFITGAVHNAIDEAGQARDSYQKGDLATAARHAADAIPVVGPTIRGLAETGSVEGENNPARMLGQITALVGGPKLADASGAVAGKLADVSPEAAADALRTSAQKQYAQVLNPTTRGNKLRTARVVPELIDRGVTAMTTKGLQAKAAGYLADTGNALEEAYANLPEGASVSTKAITERLGNLARDKFMVDAPSADGGKISMGTQGDAGIKHLSELAQRIDAASVVDPISGEKVLPVPTARRLRQFYDQVAADAGRYDAKTLADKSEGAANGFAADSIREELAQDFPDIAKINREYHLWKDVTRVIDDTVMRRQGQAKPLGRKLAGAAGTGAGFLAGGLHGAAIGKYAMDALEAATTSTGWGTVSATLKGKLADAIAGGKAGPIQFYASKAKAEAQNAAKGDTIPVSEGQPSQGEVREEPAGTPVQVSSPAGSGAGPTETSVLIPGENRQLPARYALRELSDIQTSHHGVTFQPNPKYGLKNDRDYSIQDNQAKVMTGALPGQFEPRFHVTDNPDATNGPIVIDSQGNALGGNGRGMILQRVYKSNQQGAQAYRSLLEQKAQQFGIDPAQIRSMKEPVLVREVSDDALLGKQGQAVTDLNKTGTAALRPAERAIADSRRVSQGTLDDIAGRLEAHGPDATLANVLEGKSGAEVLNKMIDDGVISPQERAGLASGDNLTPDGRARISRLIVGRFFKDAAQIDRMPVAINNKLERLAAPLAKAEGAGEWNLTPQVQEAVDLIEQSKAHGKNLDNFLKQDALLSRDPFSDESVQIAKALQDLPMRKIVEAVRQYAQDAQYAQGGDSLFGNAPTPKQSFREAFGQ